MSITADLKKQLDLCAELGWEENHTTALIKSVIKDKPIIDGFGKNKTGVLYKIGKGANGILLRADIDGLTTQRGVRHVCGHSSHTAGLMAAFIEVKRYEENLTKQNKSIYFLFQPAEETFPSGAKAFLNSYPQITKQVQFAFGVHVKPFLPLHTIGLFPGVVWARGDYMEVEIFGKMVHVKDAPLGIDALEIASHLVLYSKALQENYKNVLRINIGIMKGGLQPNTVADYALLQGDIRLQDEKYQKKVKKLLMEEVIRLKKQYKTDIKLHYYNGYPMVKNHTKLTNEIISIFQELKSWQVVTDASLFSYGCEDFAFISEKVPSVYGFVGVGGKYDIHQSKFFVSVKATESIYKYFSVVTKWWLGH